MSIGSRARRTLPLWRSHNLYRPAPRGSQHPRGKKNAAHRCFSHPELRFVPPKREQKGSKKGAKREQTPSNDVEERRWIYPRLRLSRHKILKFVYQRVPLTMLRQHLQGRGHWFDPSSAHDEVAYISVDRLGVSFMRRERLWGAEA
jgi:hypothetical protein